MGKHLQTKINTAAGRPPHHSKTTPESRRMLFHVDPLALAWGEDGEPYLLCFTEKSYHAPGALSRGKSREITLFSGWKKPCRPADRGKKRNLIYITMEWKKLYVELFTISTGFSTMLVEN